ncbi:MAG TPA: heme o synthase [Rhodothermales bacterium]|nr:heme o synthase [Rhodothermales bacterium]
MPDRLPPPGLDEAATSRTLQALAPSAIRDAVVLIKPEITFLVVLSSLAGYALGTPTGPDVLQLLGTLMGVALLSAGGAALNHVLERDADAAMHRTAPRPLPSGRIAVQTAAYTGLGLVVAGAAVLCPVSNWLAASLGLLTVALYLGVYTPLKRRTSFNTLVGTLPGALPALGGYVAATGHLGAGGWAVFALLAAWQLPHFLSIAWMYRKDYARGGFAMLTVGDAEGRKTGGWILGTTLLTVAASLLPMLTSGLGMAYSVVALALGGYLLRPALMFASDRSNANARAVLKASVVYVALLVLALVAFTWL